jgi:hypothetical protein
MALSAQREMKRQSNDIFSFTRQEEMMKKMCMLFGILVSFVSMNVVYGGSLQEVLVDLPQWQSQPAQEMKLSGPQKMHMVTRAYAQGDKKLQVQIMTGFQAKQMYQTKQQGLEMNTDQMHVTMKQEDGYPVYTAHRKNEKSGNISVFLKKGQGVLTCAYSGMGEKEALKLLKTFSWERMEQML